MPHLVSWVLACDCHMQFLDIKPVSKSVVEINRVYMLRAVVVPWSFMVSFILRSIAVILLSFVWFSLYFLAIKVAWVFVPLGLKRWLHTSCDWYPKIPGSHLVTTYKPLFLAVLVWMEGTGLLWAGHSAGCFFWVLLKRSIPKPDQHRTAIMQRELLNTVMS